MLTMILIHPPSAAEKNQRDSIAIPLFHHPAQAIIFYT
jgi:hypothetical protein